MKSSCYEAAVEYAQAPLVDPAAIYSWSALARDIGRLYRYVLTKGVAMEVIHDWRYQSYTDICRDVEQGRIIRALDFYPHPVWDLETQSLFRVVHDYFHYETGDDITIEGEYNVVMHHHRQVFSPASFPALYAEIYGQAAYALVYGEFGPNKVFIPREAMKEHLLIVEQHKQRWDWGSEEANKVLSAR
jgi:hypothetical protein